MLKKMSVMDAGLLALETPETPMHMSAVQILRMPRGVGPDYVRRLRDRAMTFPVRTAPFNYRYVRSGPVPGVPAWAVVKQVDLRKHVFHHAVPWPGTEQELLELVSRLDSAPLDRSRPLWELHLIEGLAEGRYARFARIHHSLGDGKWGVRLLQATTSPDSRARDLPPFWAADLNDKTAEPASTRRRAASRPSGTGRTRAARQDGSGAIAELRATLGRYIAAYRHPTDDGLMPLYQAPDCMLNGKVTAGRELALVRLDLPRIRRLAHAHDATINEIVMALCSGGLRRYLLERNALPQKPLVASMMIAVARTEDGSSGNAVAPGIVSLATHIADPVKRFESVRGSSRHAKELIRGLPSPTALGVYLGAATMPWVLGQATGRAEKVHAHNVVISNVPGLREKRYVNGARVEAQYPISVLVPGQGMNITVISHCDSLDVAVLVCPSLAPEPQRVADGIVASFDELERALRRPRSSRRAGTRAGPKVAKRARSAPTARGRRSTHASR